MLGETMAISGSQFGADYRDLHWYAVQTRANHEKRVRQQLDLRVVETYLPVYESLRHWKDRRVRLELPLFPGYLFVRLALRDRLQVLRTPSVVRIVEFGGKAVALPDPRNRNPAPGTHARAERRALSLPESGTPRPCYDRAITRIRGHSGPQEKQIAIRHLP